VAAARRVTHQFRSHPAASGVAGRRGRGAGELVFYMDVAARHRRRYIRAIMAGDIKLIWDFRGGDARGTAEHHARHLGEFARREKLSIQQTGAEQITDLHWIAWMVVEATDVAAVRAALRPSRGLEA
jgi:hypothetical protein